ncbi:MAG: type II toxin-antitoxin system HicB family antitoxin [Defluviitaleaceae bacterium]|nr:type II toxin-antitoxin system HicB family antitoxin [Defluviitaleaceae bacterium]
MKYVYPAIFRPEVEGGFSIFFPDIERGATQGDDMIEGMEMAEDFLCSVMYDIEEEKSEIPDPCDANRIEKLPGDIVTLIAANTDEYRRRAENKVVKKTLTIPSWLNARAEDAKINFSHTLQKALKEELQIAE